MTVASPNNLSVCDDDILKNSQIRLNSAPHRDNNSTLAYPSVNETLLPGLQSPPTF